MRPETNAANSAVEVFIANTSINTQVTLETCAPLYEWMHSAKPAEEFRGDLHEWAMFLMTNISLGRRGNPVDPGVPMNIVKELLGHQSIEMTMRYAHFAPAARDQAIACLEELHLATSTTDGQPAGNAPPQLAPEPQVPCSIPALN